MGKKLLSIFLLLNHKFNLVASVQFRFVIRFDDTELEDMHSGFHACQSAR